MLYLDDEAFDPSINLNSLEQNQNSVGIYFCYKSDLDCLDKIENLFKSIRFIVFNDQAGIKELQFKEKPTAYSILEKYYAN